MIGTVSEGFGQIAAIVDPNNHRSLRLLDRLGMTHTGDLMLPGYSYPDRVYVLLKAADGIAGGS
ncbi:hypothetical protein JANAI62_36830 [Jannaschia pagri]|uniref:Acetyltransferase (GNAT) domain-containing protein n=1 Tax=Jannaschia pagri TaxID=2829797 RepID=A0ABQ4NRP6_9RHOB|nr:hypothetical protein JANAI61_36310 [Jannaschia sp. AI_61]GIT97060.1 hypothetical protein JANAI62_36830 [Jannaschia sp. AI_62]